MAERSHDRGFTLIELLISLGILGLLFSLMVLDLSQQSKNRELEGAAMTIGNAIKEVQTMALAGATIGDQNLVPINYVFSLAKGSENCQYKIQVQAEVNGDLTDVRTVNLPAAVNVQSDSIQIYFSPPRAKIRLFVNGVDVEKLTDKPTDVDIVIGYSGLPQSWYVNVNRVSGKINVFTPTN